MLTQSPISQAIIANGSPTLEPWYLINRPVVPAFMPASMHVRQTELLNKGMRHYLDKRKDAATPLMDEAEAIWMHHVQDHDEVLAWLIENGIPCTIIKPRWSLVEPEAIEQAVLLKMRWS